MKKYISHLVFALLGCAALSACVDDDYMELDKGQNELVLTASKTEVVLNEQAHADDALELSWTTGTNYGTGNKISYTLELTKTGSDFADSYVAVENAVQEYSWKKSVEELNDILRNHFGATAGENISLEARLTATVTERDEKQVSTTAFSVTAYKPLTSTLYLIGSATPGGWSADDATEMTRKDNGIFTWTGRLVAGEFKFITTLGSFLPSYNKGTDGLLVLRSSDDQPDEPFVVEEDHNYIVEANLFTGVLTLTQTETLAPAYDQLYFVGNATDWGFVKMKQDVLDPYLFRFGKFFEVGKGGEFKFGTSDGSWENMYKAKNADAAYTDTEVVFVKGFDPDNKWVLKDGECGKAYKICMDIRSGMKLAEKFKEKPDICNAIGAHHDEVEMTSLLAPIVQVCDAISGARPGARREIVEAYIKRLNDLEQLAMSYPGVTKTYAIQAGRELRVIVGADKIDDKQTENLSGEIAKKIQDEMTYPGQVKITVIRETRAVSYAK